MSTLSEMSDHWSGTDDTLPETRHGGPCDLTTVGRMAHNTWAIQWTTQGRPLPVAPWPWDHWLPLRDDDMRLHGEGQAAIVTIWLKPAFDIRADGANH